MSGIEEGFEKARRQAREDVLDECRTPLLQRLRLMAESDVELISGISDEDFEKVRRCGALKYINTYDGRRLYEEAEILRWLKRREG